MGEFTPQYLERLAALARLRIYPAERDGLRESLDAIVAYVDRLREADLAGVEPLTHVGGGESRLADDTPDEPLPASVLLAMAPQTYDQFVRVPKVLGDGGGA
ncbi:MAG: Asp-tRNA(Asn)/Glu-tRNA(Gln) amidotransferase subunit GatC [Planctomycetota bacterium]|nr:Asp-tRNA(Asn)/Glu-tRNA(Gln) amidotransferase subunit GatC [Planctomycetota bacterium]